MLKVVLIGLGSIGKTVLLHLGSDPAIGISYVLHRTTEQMDLPCQQTVPCLRFVRSVDEIKDLPDFALECAGADAIREHVIPLMQRGVDVGLCSVGALIDEDLVHLIEQASITGNSQAHLIAGAVGGIDALASAKLLGLDSVSLTSRKPPISWAATAAELVCDLRVLTEPVVIFSGTARHAAGLYPKNANAAATVAFAGIGLDRTEVTLIADPAIVSNTHEINARGAFGEMRLVTSNKPLPENPKTSALAALSAIRAIRGQVAAVSI
jgi:aspartate dehydrogenase